MFTAKDVALLRARTNAGMMDCKKALTECDGDFEKATQWLREKGMAAASKKSGRIASEGVVGSYIHMGGKIGVLVEVNCETDFVARTDAFNALVKDIAMQIAAANPKYVSRDEVPADVLEKEKQILRAQAKNEGKPEAIIEKMVEGRVVKFYKDFCLLDQDFVKDSDQTVGKFVASKGGKIKAFYRYEVGEGIEKQEDNFVDEVMSQIK